MKATRDLATSFRDCPILVVGDLMLDEFVWGNVSRVSPEAPVPVVQVHRRTYAAGGAGNVAANIASLGARAVVIGVVGEDEAADRLAERFEEYNIDRHQLFRLANRPTTLKTRIVAQNQQMIRVDHEDTRPLGAADETRLLEHLRKHAEGVRGCILSDYGKGLITPTLAQAVVEWGRENRVPVIVDPKGTDYQKYRGAFLVKPNQHEAGLVLNRRDIGEDIERAGKELIKLLGGKTSVLITRGASGMSLFEPRKPMLEIPALAREVYDVTGAGDTVAAVLTLGIANNLTLHEATRLASVAAAAVVGRFGTVAVQLEDLFGKLPLVRSMDDKQYRMGA